jgi:cytochrome c556
MPGTFYSRLGSAVVAAALIAAAVHAADALTPVQLQKVRHDHYHELGDAFKSVRDLSKAESPDFAALITAAEVVDKASVNQGQWFPKGTGPEAGKTRALPEIWSKPDDFLAAQKMFSDRAPALLAAAKAKDLAAVQAAFKELGGACKNCHDTFRSPEDH